MNVFYEEIDWNVTLYSMKISCACVYSYLSRQDTFTQWLLLLTKIKTTKNIFEINEIVYKLNSIEIKLKKFKWNKILDEKQTKRKSEMLLFWQLTE